MGDKQYYENMKKMQEQKKNAEITVTDVTNEKEDQSEIIVTDNSEQINSQQESIKEEIISELESEDPECEKIQEQEYQEQMLNELVKKYKENMENSNDMYDQ